MKKIASGLFAFVMTMLIAVFVYWNFFPLQNFTLNDTRAEYKAPGVSVLVEKEGESMSGRGKFDIARISYSSYEGLKKAEQAYIERFHDKDSAFSHVVNEIERGAQSYGSVQEMIKKEHKAFIFF